MAGKAVWVSRLTGARRMGESRRWNYAGPDIHVFSGHINMAAPSIICTQYL